MKKEFGDKHYKYGMFLNSLGLAYAMIDDYGMALVYLKQALQILLTSLGANHVEVADVYFNLGDVCMKYLMDIDQLKGKNKGEQQVKLDEARKSYLEAQRIVRLTFGDEHTKAIQLSSLLFIVENFSSWWSFQIREKKIKALYWLIGELSVGDDWIVFRSKVINIQSFVWLTA